MNRRWPIASSTLSPNTQRNSMLPIRWSQPPCRNMLVNSVTGDGTTAASAGSAAFPHSTAGTTP